VAPAALAVIAALVAAAALVADVGPARGQADGPVRLGGVDRFDTAVQVSQHRFPDGADRVYAVRADLSPDALVASFDDGPTLLVPSCGPVPLIVMDEVLRLSTEEVVIVGGAAAVSSGVAEQLQARRSDEDAGCSDAPAGPVELLLETADTAEGLRVVGRVRNGRDEPVTVGYSFNVERQEADGSWLRIGPHLLEQGSETIAAGHTGEPRLLVPYRNEENAETYLSSGAYRLSVSIEGETPSSAYERVSAVLTIE